MPTSIGCMLYAELARCSPGSIDHLGIVIVTLSIDLMTQIFLVYVLRLVTLASDSVHHVRACADMRSIPSFKWLHVGGLPGGDDGFFGVCRADIIILMTFRAIDPIDSILLLVAQVDFLSCSIRYLLWDLIVALNSLSWSCPVMRNLLPWVIEGYVNSSVSISY